MDASIIVYYGAGVICTFLIAAAAWWGTLHGKLHLRASWIMAFCFFSVYLAVFQYLKYLNFRFYADFSHWAQLLYSISTTGKPHVLSVEFLIPGSLNYFSVHFVPITYLLSLFFKIAPRPETLIVCNFILMASSFIPLYKLAVLKTGDDLVAKLIVSALLWYPAFQYTVLYEFEVLRFSIPVIFWMLLFWERRKYLPYYLCLLAAALIREEVGMTIAFFGIYLALFEKEKRHGIATVLLGCTVFIFLSQVLMPAMRQGQAYAHVASGSFRSFGSTPGAMLKTAFTHPSLIFRTVADPVKIANIFMFFLPLLMVPFFQSAVLVSIIANIGIGLLSDSYTHTSFLLYYLSPSVPFIFYAFIKSWDRAVNALEKFTTRLRLQNRSSSRQTAVTCIFAVVIAVTVFFGPSFFSLPFWFQRCKVAPLRTQSFHRSVYYAARNHRTAERILGLIPKGSIVSTQQFFAPRLFDRKGTMIFPALESRDGAYASDHVFFDTQNNGLAPESPAYIPAAEFDKFTSDNRNWHLVASQGSYFLYSRVLPGDQR